MELQDKDVLALKALYEKLLPILRELCSLEEKIALTSAQDDPKALQDLVSGAQPTLLAFRGLEKRRGKLETELGIQGLPFPVLLDRIPESHREEFTVLFQEVSSQLRLFRERKESSERMMTIRLNDIAIRLDGQTLPQSFQDRRV